MDNIEIINLALSNINAENIDSLSENTNESLAAKLFYDPVRRSVLQKYNWAFATKTARLALIEETPINYSYAYQLPSDYIKIINITPLSEAYSEEGNVYPYIIQGRTLLCDLEEVYISYIYDIKDTNQFDDLFIDAFSHLLASRMAMRITGDRDLQVTELQLYDSLISASGAASLNSSREPKDLNPYVTARG